MAVTDNRSMDLVPPSHHQLPMGRTLDFLLSEIDLTLAPLSLGRSLTMSPSHSPMSRFIPFPPLGRFVFPLSTIPAIPTRSIVFVSRRLQGCQMLQPLRDEQHFWCHLSYYVVLLLGSSGGLGALTTDGRGPRLRVLAVLKL